MHTTTAYIALLTMVTGSWVAHAGEFSVPHQPEDQVIIHVRPNLYAHPTDYWWQRNPSFTGSWDYFTPVNQLYQPVPLEDLPGKPRTGKIPITNRIFW